MSFRIEIAGSAALRALRAGPAQVFASFERSCYVETTAGIACLGGAGIGRGPLNAILKEFPQLAAGDSVRIDFAGARTWEPAPPVVYDRIQALVVYDRIHIVPPSLVEPWQDHPQAQAFLRWLTGSGRPDDALIGLGPGLTPAGDDFVGGAMIALRTFGHPELADRIAAWALPLAATNTNRISRAHLACAAAGEGHEALHQFLDSFDDKHLEQLARIGHSSGLDAAAGAVLALANVQWRPDGDSNPGYRRERAMS